MNINYEPLHEIIEVREKPTPGSFAVPREPLEWINCRQRIAWNFQSFHPGLYFSHDPYRGHSVACFIQKTEIIIGLTNQHCTKFAKTNRSYATWVQVSKFWKDCHIRCSLFTILLRAGIEYEPEKDNYETALFSQNYTIETKLAVLRFLYGFTKFTKDPPPGVGWVTTFSGKDVLQIRQLLVQPDQEKIQSVVKIGKIWA